VTRRARAGAPTWLVVVIVLACIGSLGLAGFVVYRLRLRSAMHQEIRAIMAQVRGCARLARHRPVGRGGVGRGWQRQQASAASADELALNMWETTLLLSACLDISRHGVQWSRTHLPWCLQPVLYSDVRDRLYC